ncbi:ervatamin-C-like [Phragmites australis]|uniref:ervatamin-C-like n=1 Tax=Phragmites australis TaxID=29695 RepID=UPI002D7987CC|nr:ervatamin-C-like [Phragmites australis]
MALSIGATSVLALILFTCGLVFAASPAEAAGDSVDAGDKLMMDRFLRWQAAYNRSYPTAEEKQQRFEVYRRNIEYIEATNRAGNLTYQLGENQFTDLTEEEFLDMYAMKGMTGRVHGGARANASLSEGVAVDAPTSVDWRSNGAVTPIKNQGPSCSSCWAFVTAATIESITKIKTGKLVSLSEQELIDCDPYDGGCNLGYFVNGYRWVIQNGGLTTEANYPYQARRNYCSRSKAANHAAKISDYVQVPAGEAELQRAVAQQPVAAAIEMGGSLQFYSGGVFSGQCGTRMNHAITVVGYGADASTGLKYWIVKNSWGQSWGERGYLRMRRDVGRGGMCGIALDLAYPVV